MVFSSSFFIFVFLPVSLTIYYILFRWRKFQNIWLVFVSLFFYAWGEPKRVYLMLLSIGVNYAFGLLVEKYRLEKNKIHILITAMLLYNLSVLFVFKYMTFVLGTVGIDISNKKITLPIGISFYTFQAISYVIDVYRGQRAQKNPLNVALYIAFFPQLIAGPIVRYQTIAEQIADRKESWYDFSKGIKRFIIGLSKKLILANSFAPTVDYAFAHISELSVGSAWIGAVCYMLQIYFDFSGYSDMAIGLGRMFGFRFMENFNYPYISASVSEFWRRWHISLGSWFKDYVYIPLGGSRVNRIRLVWNLFVVWILTGIWHGANWNFVLWGFGYFLILTFEKLTGIPNKLNKTVLKRLYTLFTLLCVILGWVIFRAESLTEGVIYIRAMFFQENNGVWDALARFWLKDLMLLLIAGVLCCTPVLKNWVKIWKKKEMIVTEVAEAAMYLSLFIICISYSVNSAYNPFIYFNF